MDDNLSVNIVTSCEEIPHNGQILDPNIRYIPDDICKQLGLPVNTIVEKKSHPFLNQKRGEFIPDQFWQLVNKPQFNGLTQNDIHMILNCRVYYDYNALLKKNFKIGKKPWDDIHKLFVQSVPDDQSDDTLMQWVRKEMTDCLETFYNLCTEPELVLTDVTDIGHIVGYVYTVVAHASDHDTFEENTVCVTMDLSFAQQVAEYLCKAVSLLKKGIDVELPEDVGDSINKEVWDICIHRVPIRANLHQDNK
jgi:hypothetical protein